MRMRDRIERLASLGGVYDCPKHGQVWRYAGPEPYDCVYCLNEAEGLLRRTSADVSDQANSGAVAIDLVSIHCRVVDSGGGEVRMLVWRDTEEYPPEGTDVVVSWVRR